MNSFMKLRRRYSFWQNGTKVTNKASCLATPSFAFRWSRSDKVYGNFYGTLWLASRHEVVNLCRSVYPVAVWGSGIRTRSFVAIFISNNVFNNSCTHLIFFYQCIHCHIFDCSDTVFNSDLCGFNNISKLRVYINLYLFLFNKCSSSFIFLHFFNF